MKKSLWIGALSYLLVTFPLAFVWHLVIFESVYARLGIFNREEPIVALGFLVILAQGFILSYAFLRFRRFRPGEGPMVAGVKFGLFMGFFLWTSQVVAAAAKHEVSSLATWFLIETAYFGLQFLLVGIALGWVYARSGERAPVRA